MEINYFFNWGAGGYNTVKAVSMDDAMKKALESCDLAPEWGVVNLQPDADYKKTREYERINAGVWD
jgi:hypothetical protein